MILPLGLCSIILEAILLPNFRKHMILPKEFRYPAEVPVLYYLQKTFSGYRWTSLSLIFLTYFSVFFLLSFWAKY